MRPTRPGVPDGLQRVYGRVRSHFRSRSDDYVGLRNALNAAHMPVPFDAYLVRAAFRAVAVAVVAAVVGGVLGVVLVRAGAFDAVVPPIPRRLAALRRYELPAAAAAGALVLGAAAGVGFWRYELYRPRAVAARRRREIDVMLPHAILFMYALSRGGMNVVEVFRKLGDADDAYGEVAREFAVTTTHTDVLNESLVDALRETRDRTPSDRLARFIDDALGVVDSGGDLAAFFETESDTYLEESRAEQRQLVETLALVAEGYISLLVAGPLFLLIILMVIGLLGGNTVGQIAATVYLGVPLGSAMVVLVIDYVFGPFAGSTWTLDDGRGPPPEPPDDPRAKGYLRRKRLSAVLDRLRHPVEPFVRRPALSLAVTVPLTALVFGFLVVRGFVTVSPAALLERPVVETLELVVVPFLLVAGPLAVFQEINDRRRRSIRARFPETLSAIANVNEIGLSLSEAVGLVARRREDRLGRELERVRNDITWQGRVDGALARFANRLREPEISRTVKLLVEANRSSGDLHRTMAVAAADAVSQRQLRRERSQEVSAYIAIVAVGFLVYLGVLVLLDQFYLQGVATAVDSTGDPTDPGMARSFTGLDADTFRVLFFHSALVQAVCSSLVAGKLANNAVLSGLKLGIGFVFLTAAVFLVI